MLHSILVCASNTGGKGLISKGHKGTGGVMEINVLLYFDRAACHKTVHVCQNSLTHIHYKGKF